MTETKELLDYEAPEVFDVGDADTLTKSNRFADEPEQVGVRLRFIP